MAGGHFEGYLTSADLSWSDRRRLVAVESALRHRLTTEDELLELLASCGPNRAGAKTLEAVLERRPYGAPPTESYLETRGVQVLRNGVCRPHCARRTSSMARVSASSGWISSSPNGS